MGDEIFRPAVKRVSPGSEPSEEGPEGNFGGRGEPRCRTVAVERLRDPTDPVLDWDEVRRELLDSD